MNHRATGKEGETIAAELLARKGLEILATNWHAPRGLGLGGEIDIVALAPQENLLVFAEVKLRRNAEYGMPIEAITPKKQTQMTRLAEMYLQANPAYQNSQLRFDVIGILGSNHPLAPVVTHYENVL